MIVQTRKKQKSISPKHICGTGTAMVQSDTKRDGKGRKNPKDQLKCGSCKTTFETICSLHVHCTQHGGEGSYYFDNLTLTAFPKYGTACAFTQVSTELLDIELKTETTETSFQTVTCNSNSWELVPKRETPVRQSKSQAKLNKIWVASENRKRKYFYNDDVKTEDNDHMSIPSKETLKLDTPSTNCPDQEKAVNTPVDRDVLPSSGISADDFDITSSLIMVDKGQLRDEIKIENKNKKSKDTLHSKCVNRKRRKYKKTDKDSAVKTEYDLSSEKSHKTDELTASEMLIAISKGVSAGSPTTGEHVIDDKKEELACEMDACGTEASGHHKTTNVSGDLVEEEVNEVKSEEMATKISKKKKTPSNKSKSAGVKYKCSTCGKVGGQTLMHYHKYMHRENKDFVCETCGASFKHPRCLQLHQKQHEEKQLKCGICGAAFHRRQYLRTHMLKHTGEEPYMCETCGKSYRDKNGLSRHIRHVHEKVRNYECDICKERFFRSDHLKNHRLRHAEADKKCPFCPRMFKHPDDLLRHTKTHTGEKKWHCNICGHGFVSVSPYYVHMAKKHGMEREEAKVLKKQLQEEHKLWLQGMATMGEFATFKMEAFCQSSPGRDKPDKEQVLGESMDTPDQIDKNFSNIADMNSSVSDHERTQNELKEVSEVPFELEPGEINTQSTPAQQVTQYLFNLGNNDVSGNQTVVLDEGSSLSHFEIEIRDVEDDMQLGNIEHADKIVQTVMFVGDHIAEEVVIQDG